MRIKELLKEKRLTQQELADKMNGKDRHGIRCTHVAVIRLPRRSAPKKRRFNSHMSPLREGY